MRTPAARRWSSVLAQAEASELSQRDFARSRGINPSTLAWWKWKLGQDEFEESGFLEVVVADDPTLWVQIGAAQIQVDSGTDVELLRRVVEALS